jgi:hypothetical protein
MKGISVSKMQQQQRKRKNDQPEVEVTVIDQLIAFLVLVVLFVMIVWR